MIMSRLSKLYDALETLQREGLEINAGLERQVALCEEEIIKTEVLPVLKGNIEPALQDIRRELVLVIDYKPGEPLDLHLSRKNSFMAEVKKSGVAILPTVEPTAEPAEEPAYSTKIAEPVNSTDEDFHKGPVTRLRVTFADGHTVHEHSAARTLAAVVKEIGVDLVQMVVEEKGLIQCGLPVISRTRSKHERYASSQIDLGGGWLLMTCSSTRAKKEFLNKVSDALGIDLHVEII